MVFNSLSPATGSTLFLCAHRYASQCLYGSQRTTCKKHFCPTYHRVGSEDQTQAARHGHRDLNSLSYLSHRPVSAFLLYYILAHYRYWGTDFCMNTYFEQNYIMR